MTIEKLITATNLWAKKTESGYFFWFLV